MTPDLDGCLASEIARPTHTHRCVRLTPVHSGPHRCVCGQAFGDLSIDPDRIDDLMSQLDAMLASASRVPPIGEPMTTPSPLDDLITLTLVADANTPAQYVPLAGRQIALTTPVAVGAGGHVLGIPGLVRQGATGLEFLMTAEVPAPTDNAPAWAQALRNSLTGAFQAINRKLDNQSGDTTAIRATMTDLSNRLTAIAADVAAIKTKTGA